ncbi:hypothetical protein D3C81_1710230 [compost metagenome]
MRAVILTVRRFRDSAEPFEADWFAAGRAVTVAAFLDPFKRIFYPSQVKFMMLGERQVFSPFIYF